MAKASQEEQLPGQVEFTDHKSFEECIPKPVEEREWLGFKAYLTVEDAEALAYLFASRQIPFEQIAILESEV